MEHKHVHVATEQNRKARDSRTMLRVSFNSRSGKNSDIPVWHSEWDYSERSWFTRTVATRVDQTFDAIGKKRDGGTSRRRKRYFVLAVTAGRGERLNRLSDSAFFLPFSRFSPRHPPRRPRISQRGILIEAAAVNAETLRGLRAVR